MQGPTGMLPVILRLTTLAVVLAITSYGHQRSVLLAAIIGDKVAGGFGGTSNWARVSSGTRFEVRCAS